MKKSFLFFGKLAIIVVFSNIATVGAQNTTTYIPGDQDHTGALVLKAYDTHGRQGSYTTTQDWIANLYWKENTTYPEKYGIGFFTAQTDTEGASGAVLPTYCRMAIRRGGNVGIAFNDLSKIDTRFSLKGEMKMDGLGIKNWGAFNIIADYDNTGDGDIIFGNGGSFSNFTQTMVIKTNGDIQMKDDADLLGIDHIVGYNDIRFSGSPGSISHMKLTNDGNLGIGSNSPSSKLHVVGSALIERPNGINIKMTSNAGDTDGWIGTTSAHGLYLATNAIGTNLYLDGDDNVFVGGKVQARTEVLAKFDLFVKKGVLSEDYSIAPTGSWADYVFKKDYNLKPLHEVAAYIEKNGGLPNMPKEEEIAKEGYSMHEMNVKFLEKIEELTLYTLEQQKIINRLDTQVKELLTRRKRRDSQQTKR